MTYDMKRSIIVTIPPQSNTTMSQDDLKIRAAGAAIDYIKNISVVGIGTGSTVNHFIDCLADVKFNLEGVVSSSEASTSRLNKLGIPVLELNNVGTLEVYIDGADEINANRQLIKGGGGALTREKVIANASKKFVCIAEASKTVNVLGSFPLPVEVIPMARSFVARQIVKLGGQPQWRQNFITDNGNHILDIHNLSIMEPIAMERALNDIPGLVTAGLFAFRPADIVLLAGPTGIEVLH